jgi:hypothetical protein
MIQYIPIDSVLESIPKGIRRETDDSTLLSYCLDGYRMLSVPGEYQRLITFKKINNHIVELPENVNAINLITWSNEIHSTSNDIADFPIAHDANYNIFFKILEQSQFYNNHFLPLRNVGNSSSITCNCCNNPLLNKCSDTFSVLPDGSLMTSLRDGYVCIDYESIIKDEHDNFLIIKSPEIKKYLSLYSISQALLDRGMSKEEQAFAMYKDILGQVEIAYKRAKGSITLSNIDIHTIDQISGTGTYNQRLTRLPQNFYNKTNN